MPESHWSSRDRTLPRRNCFRWTQEHRFKVWKLKENDIKHELPPVAMQCPVIFSYSSIDQAVCKELQELGTGLLLPRGGASPRVHPSNCRNKHQPRSATRSNSSQCQSCSVHEGWLGVIGLILSPSYSARSQRFYYSKLLAWNLHSFQTRLHVCFFDQPCIQLHSIDHRCATQIVTVQIWTRYVVEMRFLVTEGLQSSWTDYLHKNPLGFGSVTPYWCSCRS
jgi:hypothetical protein